MAEDKFDRKNPAVKRILHEFKEMKSNPPTISRAFLLRRTSSSGNSPSQEGVIANLREGFTTAEFSRPWNTHFKPPSFVLLTPNGRFETQTKICLSISLHHPEHWQTSWSVFGSNFWWCNDADTDTMDYNKEERRKLAVKSLEIHEYMLTKAPPVPQLQASEDQAENGATHEKLLLQKKNRIPQTRGGWSRNNREMPLLERIRTQSRKSDPSGKLLP